MANVSIKTVIFDLDGTLMNAYRAVERSVNYTMKAVGCDPIDARTIERTVGWGERHLIETFVGKGRTEHALRIYRKHHKDALKKGTKLLPGAKRILRHLKKNRYKLAVASNRPTKFSKIAVKHLGIDAYFDYILCGDKVENPKPSPDILLKILDRFRLKPQEALYVGDMPLDAQAGKRAKVKTVIVTTGSHSRREIARLKPYGIIDHVYKVADILGKLNGN